MTDDPSPQPGFWSNITSSKRHQMTNNVIKTSSNDRRSEPPTRILEEQITTDTSKKLGPFRQSIFSRYLARYSAYVSPLLGYVYAIVNIALNIGD